MTSVSGGLRAIALAAALSGCMLASLPTDGFDACLVDHDCPDERVCKQVKGVRECVAAPPPVVDGEGEGEAEGEGAPADAPLSAPEDDSG